jgi:beta-N-acetylhexosaminidase
MAVLIMVSFLIYVSSDSDETAKLSNDFLLGNLKLDQKIGQLFIIGFEGKELTEDIKTTIKELHPGGVLLLGWNIEDRGQLLKLVEGLQQIALKDTGIPMFIAVDQEGGEINRIDFIQEKTAQNTIENPETALQVGYKRGIELKQFGISLNFAPVLDSAEPGDFIYNRSFNKEQENIGDLVKSLVLGQKNTGILTAIKHFPGYGNISFNPEEKLAVKDNIPSVDLFKQSISAKPEMVMTANVIYKNIDENFPFTFSKKGIDFLKSELGNDILIISDDLDQNSLLNKYDLEDIVSMPVESGVDILIFSGWRLSAEEGVNALIKAVENGRISEDRINQSTLKIIKLKLGIK